VLAAFNIERARDKAGNEIPISDDFKDYGFIRYIAHCTVMPASMALTYSISLAIKLPLSVQSPPGLADIVS
jgi:hypothetical protein